VLRQLRLERFVRPWSAFEEEQKKETDGGESARNGHILDSSFIFFLILSAGATMGNKLK
jgi:hypothetical protein